MAYLNIHEDTPIRVLQSVFKSFDADGNGILDRDEFNKLLSVLGIDDRIAQDACQLLADKNGDGVISKEEFYEWIKKDKIQKLMADSDKFCHLCGVSKIFRSFDVDGDNTISWKEFKEYMVGTEHHSLDTAKTLWHEIDVNNDGEITFKEYWDYTQSGSDDYNDNADAQQQYKQQQQQQYKQQEEYQQYEQYEEYEPTPTPPPVQKEQSNIPQQYVSIEKAKSMQGANRDQFLNDKDFRTVFGMTKDEFSKLKGWKQKQLKKQKGLF